MSQEQRRLSAILFTDIVGYTSAMGEDEKKAFDMLQKNRAIHLRYFRSFHATYFKQIGDGFLAVFSSVLDAFYAATLIQQETRMENYQIRLGIHEGEVIFRDNDVFGDEVNIASRIEQNARPEQICVSENVKRNIDNMAGVETSFLKKASMKNVKDDLNLYEASIDSSIAIEYLNNKTRQNISVSSRKTRKIAVVFLLVILAGFLLYLAIKTFNIQTIESFNSDQPNYSIAVLPFKNLSNNPDFNYLAEGLADDILSRLSKIQNLIIISRSSSFRFSADENDYNSIRRKLNVGKVIEGSFNMINQDIRINIQMVDTESEEVQLADTYTGTLNSLFDLQDKVSMDISEKLKLSIKKNNEVRTLDKEINIEAYKFYQLGKSLLKQDYLFPETVDKSRDYFFRSISMDSLWEEPYIGIADSYLWEIFYGQKSVSQVRDSVIFYTDKALNINPDNGEIYAIKGFMLEMDSYWKEGNKLINKSLELNPNIPLSYYAKSLTQYFRNDTEASMKYLDKVIQLDPLNDFYKNMKSFLLMFSGSMTEADSIISELLQKEPGNLTTLFARGTLENLRGNYRQAVRALEARGIGLTSNFMLAYAYAKTGNTEKATLILDNVLKRSRVQFVPYTQIAIIYIGLDDKDSALEMLSKAIEVNDNWGLWFFSGFFDPVEEDPRYQSLKKKFNLDEIRSL